MIELIYYPFMAPEIRHVYNKIKNDTDWKFAGDNRIYTSDQTAYSYNAEKNSDWFAEVDFKPLIVRIKLPDTSLMKHKTLQTVGPRKLAFLRKPKTWFLSKAILWQVKRLKKIEFEEKKFERPYPL